MAKSWSYNELRDKIIEVGRFGFIKIVQTHPLKNKYGVSPMIGFLKQSKNQEFFVSPTYWPAVREAADKQYADIQKWLEENNNPKKLEGSSKVGRPRKNKEVIDEDVDVSIVNKTKRNFEKNTENESDSEDVDSKEGF